MVIRYRVGPCTAAITLNDSLYEHLHSSHIMSRPVQRVCWVWLHPRIVSRPGDEHLDCAACRALSRLAGMLWAEIGLDGFTLTVVVNDGHATCTPTNFALTE